MDSFTRKWLGRPRNGLLARSALVAPAGCVVRLHGCLLCTYHLTPSGAQPDINKILFNQVVASPFIWKAQKQCAIQFGSFDFYLLCAVLGRAIVLFWARSERRLNVIVCLSCIALSIQFAGPLRTPSTLASRRLSFSVAKMPFFAPTDTAEIKSCAMPCQNNRNNRATTHTHSTHTRGVKETPILIH